MKKSYFSIGDAAKQAHMTTATLRHYDHIGLVKPSKVDQYTNYRYYTVEDITRLNTVHVLQQMDLPLQEIKKLLEYDDLEKIVEFLVQAEKKADEKIAALQYSKSKIQLARANSERKLAIRKNSNGIFTKDMPQRVILLSDTLEVPTLDVLWNYLNHFYDFLMEGQYEDCNKALLQIVPGIRMDMIHDFLKDIPYLSDLQRTFYQTYIQARWEKLQLPAYEQAAGQTESC